MQPDQPAEEALESQPTEPLTSPVETAAPQATTEPEVEHINVWDAIGQMGVRPEDLGGDDEEVRLRALVDGYRQARDVPQLRQMAYFGQQVAPHLTEFQEFMKAKEAEKAAAVQKEQEAYWPKPPELTALDKANLRSYERGELAREQLPLDTIRRYQEFTAWKESQTDQLLTDPAGVVWKGLEQRIEAKAREIAQQAVQQTQQQQYVSAVYQSNPDLFQTDPNGQPVFDPQTGYPALSARGQQLDQLREYVRSMGVTDPANQLDLAMALLPPAGNGQKTQQATQPGATNGATTPAQVGEIKKRLFRDRVTATGRQVNQDGTEPETETSPPQATGQGFMAIARRKAAEMGHKI